MTDKSAMLVGDERGDLPRHDTRAEGEAVADFKRPISHDEAKEAAQRLTNSHFRQEPYARASIPAKPDYDDDLVLSAYIKQRREAEITLSRQLAEARAELAEWKIGNAGHVAAEKRANERLAEAQGVIERQRKGLERIAETSCQHPAAFRAGCPACIADEVLYEIALSNHAPPKIRSRRKRHGASLTLWRWATCLRNSTKSNAARTSPKATNDRNSCYRN